MMVMFFEFVIFYMVSKQKNSFKIIYQEDSFICVKDKYEGVGSSFSLFIYFDNVV